MHDVDELYKINPVVSAIFKQFVILCYLIFKNIYSFVTSIRRDKSISASQSKNVVCVNITHIIVYKSNKRQLSGQSTFMLTGCMMYNMFDIVDILFSY